jgi:hypothetical protein
MSIAALKNLANSSTIRDNNGMADEPKGIGDAMASIGNALTSPAKLAFAGFVILAYKGALPNLSLGQFLGIAALFVLIQAFHDDFFRILLNRWAYGISARRSWPKD